MLEVSSSVLLAVESSSHNATCSRQVGYLKLVVQQSNLVHVLKGMNAESYRDSSRVPNVSPASYTHIAICWLHMSFNSLKMQCLGGTALVLILRAFISLTAARD